MHPTGLLGRVMAAERFLVDAQISAGWMHSGYPVMAYDVDSVYNVCTSTVSRDGMFDLLG